MSRVLVVAESRSQAEGLRLLLEQAGYDAELVAANQPLQQNEERYRLLFERNLAGVLLSRPSGEILDCNDSFARMLGYSSRAEVMTHPTTEFYFSPADREALLGELRARGALTNHEFLMRRQDGSGLWVLANINLLEDAQAGTVVHVMLLDISERRRAEEDVRRWRDRYEAAARASGHILYDADETTGSVAYSGNVEGMLGYQEKELTGPLERWLTVVHPQDQDAVRREVAKVREQDGAFRLEYRVRRKDGSWVTIQDRGQAVQDSQGRVAHVIGFVTDVTEQRSLEAQLRQAQKMEAVGRLAGGVAHDFNNLIQVVTGYSELVLASLPPDHPQREPIAGIKRAGERAAALTRQLLAFSSRQLVAPRLLDLNEAVREVEGMLRRLIGEDITLATSLDTDLGLVWADPGQVEQVLVNLCVNARDAMPRGGELTIETSNAELDAEYARVRPEVRPGCYVLLTVSDTGHGMDEVTRVHVFEPFFTTKDPGKGTGLGLATVYGIVKQAGGFVYVYSEPGWGATFKVYLPRVGEDALTEGFRPEPAAPGPEGGNETLLLVEDEGPVRALTRDVLRAVGYRVLEAADGNQALLLCEGFEGPLHLLVTDVVMPVLGGRGLAECLTALRPGLKVLFLSGYAADAVIRHGVLASEVDFLQKPFTGAALTRKVREVLDRPSAAR